MPLPGLDSIEFEVTCTNLNGEYVMNFHHSDSPLLVSHLIEEVGLKITTYETNVFGAEHPTRPLVHHSELKHGQQLTVKLLVPSYKEFARKKEEAERMTRNLHRIWASELRSEDASELGKITAKDIPQ